MAGVGRAWSRAAVPWPRRRGRSYDGRSGRGGRMTGAAAWEAYDGRGDMGGHMTDAATWVAV